MAVSLSMSELLEKYPLKEPIEPEMLALAQRAHENVLKLIPLLGRWGQFYSKLTPAALTSCIHNYAVLEYAQSIPGAYFNGEPISDDPQTVITKITTEVFKLFAENKYPPERLAIVLSEIIDANI